MWHIGVYCKLVVCKHVICVTANVAKNRLQAKEKGIMNIPTYPVHQQALLLVVS